MWLQYCQKRVALLILFPFSFQSISIPVFFLRLGMDFSLKAKFQYQLRFPSGGNSLNPPKLTVQVSYQIFYHRVAYLLKLIFLVHWNSKKERKEILRLQNFRRSSRSSTKLLDCCRKFTYKKISDRIFSGHEKGEEVQLIPSSSHSYIYVTLFVTCWNH